MIGRRSLLILISYVAIFILSFLATSIISTRFGASTFGFLLFFLALLNMFGAIFDFGFSTAHVKRISEGVGFDECVSTLLFFKSIVIWPVIAISFLIEFLSQTDGGQALSGDGITAIILITLYYALSSLTSSISISYQAKTQSAKSQFLLAIDPIVRLIALVVLSFLSSNILNLSIVYFISAIVALLVAIYMLRRDGFRARRPKLLKSYYIFAVPLAVTLIITTFAANIDRIMIGFSSTADLAFYSTSQTIVSGLYYVGLSVSSLTFPIFSALYEKGALGKINEITMKSERYILMIGMPAIVLLLVFPSEISIILFGPGWGAAAQPLRILTIGMLFNLLTTVNYTQVLAMNRPDIAAKASIIYSVICILLLVVLVPQSLFGIQFLGLSATGAAIAVMVASLANMILIKQAIRRLTGFSTPSVLLRFFIAAGLLAVVMVILSQVFRMTGWFELSLFILVSYLIYESILVLLRELKKSDMDYFVEIVNPLKMLNYVVDEFRTRKNP